MTDTLNPPAPAKAEGVPILMTGQALRSLRDSGFSLPTALAEVVDNAIEAKAKAITVRIDVHPESDDVTRIVVADDGVGMDAKLLQSYLQIGFSTRYLRTDGIGKYGVGAKLAALNFGTKISAWSRTAPDDVWMKVSFDLDAAIEVENQTGKFPPIAAPKQVMPSKRYSELIPKGSGTIIVWENIDRLQRGRTATTSKELITDVRQELARMFREFINARVRIKVNDVQLLSHDPLFLMGGTWAETYLSKLPANKNVEASNRGAPLFPASVIADEEVPVGGGYAHLRVTLYPAEATRKRGQGGDEIARAMQIPANEGAISVVRMGREIAYTTVPKMLPFGVKTNDRFIGIEIAFDAKLDDYFGVRNVKRGVEPDGELRRKIRELLRRYIPQARKMLNERWGKVSRDEKEHEGEHSSILEAVKNADRALPKSKTKPVPLERIEEELRELAEDAGHDTEEDQKRYIDKIRGLPFVLESVGYPGNQFISTTHLSSQVIIRLNTRHRFYKEIWKPLSEIAGTVAENLSGDDAVKTARRAVEGLALMVVAYGKAQSMTNDPTEYDELTSDWGKFLETLMDKIRDVI